MYNTFRTYKYKGKKKYRKNKKIYQHGQYNPKKLIHSLDRKNFSGYIEPPKFKP